MHECCQPRCTECQRNQKLSKTKLLTNKYTSSFFFLVFLLTGISILIGSFGLAFGAMQASTHLHHSLLSNTLRSPMGFFDTTPLGRLVNRFSQDMDIIDMLIPKTGEWWLKCINSVVGTVFIVCYGTPLFLVPLLPLLILYYLVQVLHAVGSTLCVYSYNHMLQKAFSW